MQYKTSFAVFLILFLHSVYISSQGADNMHMGDTPKKELKNMAESDTMTEMEEVAHSFFSHMGVPEAVGVYSLRLSGLVTDMEGMMDGDFGFHLETGLTDFIGLHIRNDGIRDAQHTEVMFQFAAIRSRDKMSGFSPLIEFEFPTKPGGDRHTNVLVGFTTALAGPGLAFNQALHYNSRTEEFEFNASFVAKVGSRIFPIVEIFAEALPHEKPIINVLGGVKVKVSKKLLLGVAFQAPVTEQKDYSWQLIFQPDIEWKRNTMKK